LLVLMNRNVVMEIVERRLRSAPGVKVVLYLDKEVRKEIARLETIAESHGAVGGLMKFVNRGVWEVLSRQVCLLLVIKQGYQVSGPTDRMVHIVDQAGQVLGEYVTPERKEELLRERPDSFFLTEDFMMHSGWKSVGEPYFLIDEVRIHDLDDIEEITNVTSGSMTTPSDEVIRDFFGFNKNDEHTRLVGFDFKDEAGDTGWEPLGPVW
jgi:hypothetical protein